MKFIHKTLIFLFLAGIYPAAYAAVADYEPVSCGFFNDASDNGENKDDKKEGEKGGKKQGGAEPDCE